MINTLFKKGLLLWALLLPSCVWAENLGVVAQVYPIAEPNMLTVIHQKLQTLLVTGQLTRIQQQVRARVKAHVLRPPAVVGLSPNARVKRFNYIPQVTLSHNVYDSQGHILFVSGTRINTLDAKSVHKVFPYAVVPVFNEVLLFINADRPAEVAFAQKKIAQIRRHHAGQVIKVILVKGNLAKASHALGRIYFDQAGRLCQKLHITGTPAVVTREGDHLVIDEVAV